ATSGPTAAAGTAARGPAEHHAFQPQASCGADVDTYVEILDDSGAVAAADDDSGDGVCSLARAAGLPPGRAYVRVRASSFALLPAFGYRLTLATAAPPRGARTPP